MGTEVPSAVAARKCVPCPREGPRRKVNPPEGLSYFSHSGRIAQNAWTQAEPLFAHFGALVQGNWDMRNRNPEIVEILEEDPPSFQCRKCGQRWTPSITPKGRFAGGSWQCPNGCKPYIADLPESTRALLKGFMRDLSDIHADPSLSEEVDDKMMAITCRLAIKEVHARFAELARDGIVSEEELSKSDEWLSIEKESSPLRRLKRRAMYTGRLLRKIEKDLKWIREKWGL